LPYHMPKTPSYLPSPRISACCAPHTAVAASSSLRPGSKRMWERSSHFLAARRFWSRPPMGEPR
jgi:hypothetical protein